MIIITRRHVVGLLIALCVGSGLLANPHSANAAAPAGPYTENWDSIKTNYKTPDWFKEEKFGLFMHWGLYSVPAHGSEWYVKYMYTSGNAVMTWHIENFGPLDKFGYKDFIPKFTAAKWDPDAWAELFRKSGAKYVVPTGEHHDGFSLWDSALNKYNAKNMGPHRDLIGDLAKAVRAKGLKFGISNHSVEHFNFIPAAPGSDQTDPEWAAFYNVADHSPAARKKFDELWVAKNFELIDKYQPDMLWFDNGVNGRNFDPQKLQVAAYYYNRAAEWNKSVTLSTKGTAYLAGSVMDYERQGRILPRGLKDFAWQVDDPIGEKFGYNTNIKHYKDAALLVRRLVDTVSMNGNYLLNLSPDSQGIIDQDQQDRLLAIGKWLGINGDAIYGSSPWTRYGEGPYYDAPAARAADDPPSESFTAREIRFTVKGDALFAFVMDWPGAAATIVSLGSDKLPGQKIQRVELLGHTGELQFTQDASGLHVTMPTEKPCDFVYALKISGLKM